MITETIKTPEPLVNTAVTKSNINMMYFVTNYPSDFIERCWSKDIGLSVYFRAKFNAFHEKHGPTAGFVTFFLYLGTGHQRTLTSWIHDNYNSGMY